MVAKSLFAQGIAPGDLVEITLTAGFALTCGIFWLRRRPMVLPGAAALRLVPLGAAMTVSQAAYHLTISLANVTTAIFLQYTAPALVAAYTAAVHCEALGAAHLTAVAGAMVGGYLLVVGPGGLAVPPAAAASGMASAVGFAAWVLLGGDRGALRALPLRPALPGQPHGQPDCDARACGGLSRRGAAAGKGARRPGPCGGRVHPGVGDPGAGTVPGAEASLADPPPHSFA